MNANRRTMLLSTLGAGLGAASLARAQQAAAPAAATGAGAAPAAPVGVGAAMGYTGSPDVVAGIPVNYLEDKTGTYTLPDALKMNDGTVVRTPAQWARRRPEILKMFEENQYGRAPARPKDMTFDVFDKGTVALNGLAKRKQIRVYFTRDKSGPVMNLTLYTPTKATRPVPLFLGLGGSVAADPGVAPPLRYDPQTGLRTPAAPRAGAPGAVAGRAGAPTPATAGGRGPVVPAGPSNMEKLLMAGFGYAAFANGDIDPDAMGQQKVGIRGVYLKPGHDYPEPDEWGAIAAWAWGISRAIDYLETDKDVDAKRIAIHGVSRLGKTVMWAGANDTRVALTIASCSGEGGAALSRRNFGETIAHLTAPSRYPYQFAANYARYGADPNSAPMDGNLLVALHAPRPLLLQTGTTDGWSDPHGEFLSAVDASKVYTLLGKQGLGTTVWPKAKEGILHDLGYYMHEGPHGTVPTDWDVYIDFLKMHLKPEA